MPRRERYVRRFYTQRVLREEVLSGSAPQRLGRATFSGRGSCDQHTLSAACSRGTLGVSGRWSLAAVCCTSCWRLSGERLAPSLFGHLGGWSDNGAASRHPHRTGFPRARKRYLVKLGRISRRTMASGRLVLQFLASGFQC